MAAHHTMPRSADPSSDQWGCRQPARSQRQIWKARDGYLYGRLDLSFSSTVTGNLSCDFSRCICSRDQIYRCVKHDKNTNSTFIRQNSRYFPQSFCFAAAIGVRHDY